MRCIGATKVDMEAGKPHIEEALSQVMVLNDLRLMPISSEQRLNRYVELAADFFDVALAACSVITLDRRWVKASRGMEHECAERRFSICDHAIRSNNLLLVRDLEKDKRFADNPLVTGKPFLRSYAGTPLVLKSGHRIGTVCLLDTRVRDYDQTQCEMLELFGSLVLAELDAKGGLQEKGAFPAALTPAD